MLLQENTNNGLPQCHEHDFLTYYFEYLQKYRQHISIEVMM